MEKDVITIANLKCEGCEATIKNKLLALSGVSAVDVIHEQDQVTVYHDATVQRGTLINMLHSLGYPEATEENGLFLQLKSYASCMVGRVSNAIGK